MSVLTLTFLGASLGVFIAAIMYMMSKFLNFQLLEHNAKREVLESIISALTLITIAATIPYITQWEKSVMKDLYTAAFASHPLTIYEYDWQQDEVKATTLFPELFDRDVSPAFLSAMLMKAILSEVQMAMESVYKIDMLSNSILGMGKQDVFQGMPRSAGGPLKTFAAFTSSLLNLFYFIYLFFRYMIYVLLFADTFALTVLLPAGVVLRSIPFTRGIGAFFIALSLSLYFVFPFAFFLVLTITTEPGSLTQIYNLPTPSLFNSQTGFSYLGYLRMWLTAFKNDITFLLTNISHVIQTLLQNVCLLPLVSIAITFTSIHGLNTLFGARISEIGRGLIKFI